MLKIKAEINSVEKLQKLTDFVNLMAGLSTNKEFQLYIQMKCKETIKQVALNTFSFSTTTNETEKQLYLDSIHIEEASDKGFKIVSNVEIDKPTTDISIGYTFNLSMAFEYGTGIVGLEQGIDHPSSWEYNVNNHKVIADNQLLDGWWLSIEKNGNNPYLAVAKHGKAVVTQGYAGMEIFRNSAIMINTYLEKWVKDYIRKNGGVSL